MPIDYKRLFLEARRKYAVDLAYLKRKFKGNSKKLRDFVANSQKVVYVSGPGFEKYSDGLGGFFLENTKVNLGKRRKPLVANVIWVEENLSYKDKFLLFVHEYGHYWSYLLATAPESSAVSAALHTYSKFEKFGVSLNLPESSKETVLVEELSAAILGSIFLASLGVEDEVMKDFIKHQNDNLLYYFKDLYVANKET